MRILTSVKLSPHKYKTPEGYLVCQDAILARTGKQDYYKSEIYENFDGEDEVVSVDRTPEQVFAAETLASFENKPITVEHPNESVGPDNWDQLAVGNVRNVRKGTYNGQDVMIADLIINRADAIEDIENGIRTELSCGYDCDITEGPNPQQINIRGNHLALCEQGRAGIAKIIDSKPVKNMVEVRCYYDKKLRGLESSEKFNNIEKAIEFIWDKLQKGNYVKIGNQVFNPGDEFELSKETIKLFDSKPVKDATYLAIGYPDEENIYHGHHTKKEEWEFTASNDKEAERKAFDHFYYFHEVRVEKIKDSLTKDVQPRKNESKDDFISRFMEETKKEYPDEKQRVAVAYSYWDRAKGIKDSENSEEYRGFVIYNVSNNYQPQKYHVTSLYKIVPDINKWEFKTIGEAEEAIDKYLATTITDSTAMLPIDTKDKLRKYFGSVSKHMSNDVKIEDIITPITEMGLNPIREKIDGWKEIADGFYRKNYFFTIDGFNDLFMISLYADSRDNWKVNEVNAYFIGKKQDLNYDAMPEIRTSNEIRGWLLDVIEEADNKSQSVREYFDSKNWLNNMMTRIVNENLVIGRWNESANTAEKLDTIILDPGMSLEELENQLKQSTLITDNKLVMNSNKDSKNKYVIYKENGKFKGTAYDNYSADIINANKVQDYSDFENLEQLVEYLLDNTNVKRENIITIGDSLSKSLLKKQIKSLEKQYDNLEKEDEKIKDENKELYAKQKGKLKKELQRQIEKKKAELVEDSKDPCDLNIKEWYMSEHPDDSFGEEINDNVTFNDLFDTLDSRQSVYNLLGNSIDSVIREACFEKLAELIGKSYDYVYNQWLLCDEG